MEKEGGPKEREEMKKARRGGKEKEETERNGKVERGGRWRKVEGLG
jgi:hypothetical protein